MDRCLTILAALQRTQVQVPAPTSRVSQLPMTIDQGTSTTSSNSVHSCVHMVLIHTVHTHICRQKSFFIKEYTSKFLITLGT